MQLARNETVVLSVTSDGRNDDDEDAGGGRKITQTRAV